MSSEERFYIENAEDLLNLLVKLRDEAGLDLTKTEINTAIAFDEAGIMCNEHEPRTIKTSAVYLSHNEWSDWSDLTFKKE